MKLPKILAGTSVSVFLLSLMLPGFCYDGADLASAMIGIQLVGIGWVAISAGIFAWLGNPLLFAAWICFLLRRTVLAAVFSVMAMLAMLEFLTHLNQKLEFIKNSSPSIITTCGPGYYLWLASSALMLGATFAALLLPEEKPNQAPQRNASKTSVSTIKSPVRHG